ncbi:hypothetical protein IQ64_47595 [Streptomyces stelliscabiei]|nr:hypothetical protein IQ64_47595 [Streptomyces stelliscabiei]
MRGDLPGLEAQDGDHRRAPRARRRHFVRVDQHQVALGDHPFDVVLGVRELLVKADAQILQRLGAVRCERVVLEVVGAYVAVDDVGVPRSNTPLRTRTATAFW